MRLADFILRNIEPILEEWETFAASLLPAAKDLDSMALRDHAQQILQAIAHDLTMPQTRDQQRQKSLGRAPQLSGAPETAAQTHAVLRARSGFNINQLAAEYRALRASVLRLWMDQCESVAPHLDDMIRFNEAIDQALAESVSFFSMQVEQAHNLLLGMLGHDMRSPLQTIRMTASYLAALNAGEAVSDAAARLIRSGARMQTLLDDLCDFNRTKLGLGVNISPRDVDLAEVFVDVVDQLRASHPGRQIDLELTGNLQGYWDGQRLQQLLGNLVLNAINYGAQDAPVRVVASADDDEVCFEVRNIGPAIDEETLERMFDPLQRGPCHTAVSDAQAGLGLGLYIASEIARAHRGSIYVRSDSTETAFGVRLPRRP
ncbi:sensor histidine kinase [Cupriavidus pinatubonensis]|uniref:sensor histidine kinase n=1 Tax=Cupriavidus pinatubonensis TaxID=248026 RepID=UPI00112A54D6|nr:sensor histidine kinase [Cupriavidus pinatubonensis]QYY28572.1 sensor histidine kinase [Cupriavidus pinatubonensis]TPQ30187.1 two-component sensor histidine kinase [Cupriavidus pinatubonensis]